MAVTTEDQSQVVAWLSSPVAHGGEAVSVIQTHASVVFVAQSRALKLKRAVRYDYLDYSSAERRRAMCEAELRINERMAPGLYKRVCAVTRETDGSLALAGRGTPVDWVVEMARFDDALLFDQLAARGALDLDLMRPLGVEIARFHNSAARRPEHGGTAGMTWVIDGNAAGFAIEGAGLLDQAACAAITAAARTELDRRADFLDARRRNGWVRQCHGDLHLRNIVLLEHRPTLFDGIEFNDAIACGDVLYDLAFLLMDLWHRGLRRHANAVLDGYLSVTGDLAGLALLPLFLSCRAAVRAKTSATAAHLEGDGRRRTALAALAREYLVMADQFLHPIEGVVVAVGGYSGSGKTTVARGLAPLVGRVPGAVLVRSDEIRKQLGGVAPATRLGPEWYRSDVSRRVYATVLDRAARIARAGHAAIADAVFAEAGDRQAIEDIAHAAGVPFVGIWLDADEATLLARVAERRGDPSDADAAVVRQQCAQPPMTIAWHRLDGSGTPETVLAAAREVIAGASVPGLHL